ncbi:MAG: hypothetical protein WD200_05280 [Candidatus Andersenbacteria bacterium]
MKYMSLARLFWISVGVGLLVQGTIWKHTALIDAAGWMERIQAFHDHNFAFFDYFLFANPSMPIIVLGTTARMLGITLLNSLYGAVIFINALTIAGAITVTYLLRPASLWWLATGGILMVHNAYAHSTPHDAVIAPLLTLVVLLTLYLHEGSRVSSKPVFYLSLAYGASLATYITLSLLWAPFLVAVLFRKINLKQFAVLLVTILLAWLIFDPLLWIMPVEHFRAMFSHAYVQAVELRPVALPLSGFLTVAPLSLVGILLALAAILFPNRAILVVPKYFFVALMGLTLLVSIVILSSAKPDFRYFHSLIFIWDVFLTLILLTTVQTSRGRPWLSWAIIFCLTMANLALLVIG